MVSVCLPSNALLQHLPYYLGFSYLGRGVSLHGFASKAQPLLLIFDEGYLLTTALPDLKHWVAPLGPPVPAQPQIYTKKNKNMCLKIYICVFSGLGLGIITLSNNFIYLFLAVRVLVASFFFLKLQWAWAILIAMCKLLIEVTSLIARQGSRTCALLSCSTWTQ